LLTPGKTKANIIRDAETLPSCAGQLCGDLGSTTFDLFGAEQKAPAARFSCMGLLLLVGGGRAVAISAETSVIEQRCGARLTYTRRPAEAECAALWQLPSVV
jgi:hypothetical protein